MTEVAAAVCFLYDSSPQCFICDNCSSFSACHSFMVV